MFIIIKKNVYVNDFVEQKKIFLKQKTNHSCGSCRRHKGIGIFKLPKENDDNKWRDEWLGEITKTRTVDKSFKEKIDKNLVFTCEKHYK